MGFPRQMEPRFSSSWFVSGSSNELWYRLHAVIPQNLGWWDLHVAHSSESAYLQNWFSGPPEESVCHQKHLLHFCLKYLGLQLCPFQIKTDTICVQSHKYRKLFSEWNLFFKKFMRHSREKKRKWTQYTVDSEREESVVGKSKSLRAKIPQSSNSALPLLTLLTSLCLSFLICKMGIIICLSYRILWWRVQIVSQIHSSFLSIWLIN